DDRQLSYRADGWQRLTAKAQGPNVEEIVAVELGGGVPLHGEHELCRVHANAVVRNANERYATARGHHLDLSRPGDDSIFDQLLARSRRPLDHLSGGDAVAGLR